MSSTFLELTDDELLQKIDGIGEFNVGYWQEKNGRWTAGIRVGARKLVMGLSDHDDEVAAVEAAAELERRIDALSNRRGFTKTVDTEIEKKQN